PISPELERALWQQWQLTQVITKASGHPGGEAQNKRSRPIWGCVCSKSCARRWPIPTTQTV
ncbi:MAG TPA: hypothetical protein V6D02_06945, partial [Candidatus Obscuribacterales bacterium]